MLKLWSLTDNFPDESITKRSKGDIQTKAKTPELTLDGHTQNISACKWLTDNTVCTASWDHTIKLWDLHTAQETQTINSANKIFLSVDYSKLNNLLLATVNDRHIRLYDPRSHEGSLVKSTFTSHNGWCTSVSMSKIREHLFVSGSYDDLVKLWDMRSPRTPLYDLSGHDDKVFSVDWSENNNILSGSADNTVKIFNTTDSMMHMNGASSKITTKLSKNKNLKSNNHR
jgi:ribosome biogenesis protein YTM1